MDRHTPSAESIPRVHSLRKTKLFFFFFRHRWRHKHFSPVAERNKMCGKKRRMNRTKNQSFMFHTAFSVRHRFQKRQAVNPGNSGGPIFNEKNEVVGVTVSKLSNADNMGFGIRVEALRKLLEFVEAADRTAFQVQCDSCDELISEEEEFCPSCGEKLPEGIFEEREPSSLSTFCERAIREMGVNPILARDGYDSWTFHKGSSEVRIFVYENTYLFAVSPINLLPKKEVERVLDYILSEDFSPYKLGIEGRQIYIAYRVHLSDITDASEDEILTNLVNLALKADEMDNMMVEEFGCEFSEYSKHED